MFVDVHTHNKQSGKGFSIVNLSVGDAANFLSSHSTDKISVGIHPAEGSDFDNLLIKQLAIIGKDSRIAAIGECGLDKNTGIPIEQQMQLFEQQIDIAEQLQKPLIIHCVGCFNQLFELKKNKNLKQQWIIHGFRGKPQLALQALKMNLGLSFGEYYHPESLKITPFDKLFLETDTSSLSIETLYSKAAILKNCAPSALTAGSKLFFSLQYQNTAHNQLAT